MTEKREEFNLRKRSLELLGRNTPTSIIRGAEQLAKEYAKALAADSETLRKSLLAIEAMCDPNNPSHENIWRESFSVLNKDD